MIKYRSLAEGRGQNGILRAVSLVLLVVAVFLGLWIGFDRNRGGGANQAGVSSAARGNVAKSGKEQEAEKLEINGGGVGATKVSGSHRQPLQFRAKPVAPAAVLAVLASGKQTVDERVRQLQSMRGISLSKEERECTLSFLSGQQVPEGIGKGSMHWLADELLTMMRLQEPPDEDLAVELGNAAFQPEADPVVRDYIMQHLWHLWEQSGSREEIEKSLWQAVDTADETTPGTALIALSRGYERDGQEERLAKVRQGALTLAGNPNSPLAVRVTALSIAGDGGGKEVKRLAGELVGNPETPVILRKVAERVLR